MLLLRGRFPVEIGQQRANVQGIDGRYGCITEYPIIGVRTKRALISSANHQIEETKYVE